MALLLCQGSCQENMKRIQPLNRFWLRKNLLFPYGALPTLFALCSSVLEAGLGPQKFSPRGCISDTETSCWWLIYTSDTWFRSRDLTVIDSTVLSCLRRQSLVIAKIKTSCWLMQHVKLLLFFFFLSEVVWVHIKQTLAIFSLSLNVR